jgi:hypothetical protein
MESRLAERIAINAWRLRVPTVLTVSLRVPPPLEGGFETSEKVSISETTVQG